LARPDVLAAEVSTMLNRINVEKQGELFLVAKHFLGVDDVNVVRVQVLPTFLLSFIPYSYYTHDIYLVGC
jgi:hypothetical protein